MKKNNDTKDYSEQLDCLNSQPYYASKKIVIQSSDIPERRTGSYRYKKSNWLQQYCILGHVNLLITASQRFTVLLHT